MEVRDYSQKLENVRSKFKDAQADLRESYDKNIEDLKKTFDYKTNKQQKVYSEQKTALEEGNSKTADKYNEITKKTIADNQEKFLSDIKNFKNSSLIERNLDRQVSQEKLNYLKDAYDKSVGQNEKLHSEALRSMEERYGRSMASSNQVFNEQVKNVEDRSKDQFDKSMIERRAERDDILATKNQEINDLRESSTSDKNRMINSLREGNENQRQGFESDLKNLTQQQDTRLREINDAKQAEYLRGQQNFVALQDSLKKRNSYEQEKIQREQVRENKETEKKFNDDLRNIQRLSDQKLASTGLGTKNGTEKDKVVNSYEEKLRRVNQEMRSNELSQKEKENQLEDSYRDKFKELKQTKSDAISKNELESKKYLSDKISDMKSKNEEFSDELRKDNANSLAQKDDQLQRMNKETKKKQLSQRVEFGKVVNTLNEKSVETLSNIKDEFAKEKTQYIEKSKKEFNSNLVDQKETFLRQLELKDAVTAQKNDELEKNYSKTIDAYENKIAQIQRKAQQELDVIKSNEEEKRLKDEQAHANELATIDQDHTREVKELRDKYERMIYKDRSDNEKLINKIVQKYEDHIGRERLDNQKTLNVKLSEAQANFERLYKTSELEKSTMRKQFEDRLLQLKDAMSDSTKKA